MSGSLATSLAGERETIQTVVEFVDAKDYDTHRTRLIEESRQRSSQNTIFLLGRTAKEIDDKVAEIYRCREIMQRHRSDPDQEVKDYCAAQGDRATKLAGELQAALKQSLVNGSFVFRANPTAVNSLDQDVLEASKRHLKDVANDVFDRYSEAPVRADTTLAEKFLRIGNLKAITSQLDPLSLVQVTGGTPQVKTGQKALVSIRDHIDKNGTVEGKRMIDHFTGAPFGWSQDTLRYCVAALLVAGEIKLKVGGREVTVNGQQAIEALRTNNAFKTVGVSLREGRPSMEVLARAAGRLTDLIGDTVVPLEDEISKVATKHFPQFQHKCGPLAEKLDALGLPGADTIRSITQDLADILLTDASDAPQRLGGEESTLYDGLKWASQVEVTLKQGLEPTVRELQQHRREIGSLPQSGVPGKLRDDLAEELSLLEERLVHNDFCKHVADFNTSLTTIKARTRDAAIEMAAAQQTTIKEAQQDLPRLPEWTELTQEERSQTLAQLEELVIEASDDLPGLKKLLSQEYVIASRLSELKKHIEQLGRNRQLQRIEEEKEKAKKAGKTKLSRSLTVPAAVTSASQLEGLIQQLQNLKSEMALFSDIEVTIKIED